MAKAEDEFRRGEVTSNTDDHTVDGAVAFDLYPVSGAAREVGTIGSLGDNTLEVRQRQPVAGQADVNCLRNQLKTRMNSPEQMLQLTSAHFQRTTRQVS